MEAMTVSMDIQVAMYVHTDPYDGQRGKADQPEV